MTDTDEIYYDDMVSAFKGAEIERDGVIVDVEAIITSSNDPIDGEPRYSLEVRPRRSGNGGQAE